MKNSGLSRIIKGNPGRLNADLDRKTRRILTSVRRKIKKRVRKNLSDEQIMLRRLDNYGCRAIRAGSSLIDIYNGWNEDSGYVEFNEALEFSFNKLGDGGSCK